MIDIVFHMSILIVIRRQRASASWRNKSLRGKLYKLIFQLRLWPPGLFCLIKLAVADKKVE